MENKKLVNTVKRIMENEELNEMAQIAGALKDAIEKVINDNPELEGLALKKAIRANADVVTALAGDQLYDNQLNRFISLAKGERELGQRGRPAGEKMMTLGNKVDAMSPENQAKIEAFMATLGGEMDMPMEESLNESFTRMQKLAGVIK